MASCLHGTALSSGGASETRMLISLRSFSFADSPGSRPAANAEPDKDKRTSKRLEETDQDILGKIINILFRKIEYSSPWRMRSDPPGLPQGLGTQPVRLFVSDEFAFPWIKLNF